MKKTIHCFISGRVQGVFFRATTADQARQLGITGWVRNLPDGRVEVKATADNETLEEFKRWLTDGPERANVSDLEINEIDLEEFDEFTVQ